MQRESVARHLASNDESRASVNINSIQKLFTQFGLNSIFLLRKNSRVSKPPAVEEPCTGKGRNKNTRTNMFGGYSTLERHENCLENFGRKHEWKRLLRQPVLI